MKRYFIEDVKCGISAGGMACGPIEGEVIASLKINDGETIKWLSLAEVIGIPNVFLTENDVFDMLINDMSDECSDYINDHFIDNYEGIAFGEDYSDSFVSISENPDNPAVPVVRYLIALIRCSMEETESLIELGKRKYADEIDIPISDVEQDYIENQEEYEEE